jgi:hypothetical protein
VHYGKSPQKWGTFLTPGYWSDLLRTGGPGTPDKDQNHHALVFLVSSGEVRPRNSAFRIWIRIN